ncbi:MAG: hypothetical protein CVV06_14340 [Gammaproteobacteria bacterium HGW-Gammaproteobacteria-10]|nr:MAG: hypothetical protein CVV06_14340 [Gammaproteobacteria bacterium HGW-Gammaproteobacteria-10]
MADVGKTSEDNFLRWTDFNFGVSNDIGGSATTPEGFLRDRTRSAAELLKVSDSLQVEFVTRNVGNNLDMMVLYPGVNPTHIIACIEGGVEDLADGRKNPSVQTIDLATGNVTTILRGMDRCDGIRTTPWGTILATEETDDGGAYEIIDPLNTVENTVTDRAAGTITGATASNIAKRDALPTMAWEGLAVLRGGVVIAGDEERPGSDVDDNGGNDTDGGALFKFVPSAIRNDGSNITDLSQSPLVSGTTYALQVSCFNDRVQHGQGCEVGNGSWVEVVAADARKDANRKNATGFYRPEDLHRDPDFTGAGVRFCWTNTGNEGAKHYAELMCGIDSSPNEAVADELSVIINRFVEGNRDMNSFDNLDFQPGTGMHYIVEDHPNGDIWACLPDGADRDIKSDGCVKVLSVIDDSAEPSGFIFAPDGKTAYVSIQHSDDAPGTEFDGYDTDDLIKITGFNTRLFKPSELDALLNLQSGQASTQPDNTIRLDNFTFGGQPLSVNIKINMDGTWELR